jgi:transposase-like protein
MIFKHRERPNKGKVVQSSKMQGPKCNREDVVKNGHQYGKQCYRCKQCNRQFVQTYSERGDSEDAKQICLTNVL